MKQDKNNPVRRGMALAAIILIVLVYVYCGYAVLSGRFDPSDALMICAAGTLGFPVLAWLFIVSFDALRRRRDDPDKKDQ